MVNQDHYRGGRLDNGPDPGRGPAEVPLQSRRRRRFRKGSSNHFSFPLFSLSLFPTHFDYFKQNRECECEATLPRKRKYINLSFLCLRGKKEILCYKREIGVPTYPALRPPTWKRQQADIELLTPSFSKQSKPSYLLRVRPRESRHISEGRGVSWNQALLFLLISLLL